MSDLRKNAKANGGDAGQDVGQDIGQDAGEDVGRDPGHDSAYEETLKKLFVLKRFGVKLDLRGPRRALRLLGDPHLKYPVIHIGGTNGKGSTAAMVAEMLRKGGLRVGLFTSPHLNRFTERIKVSGEEISKGNVVELFQVISSLDPDLTFFERTALMAFVYFHRSEVDVAIVEVGLGGRLDVTNLVEPVVTGIMQIAADHTAYLGRDITRIAWEKAGILRPGVPAVMAPGESKEAVEVLKNMSQARGAKSYFWNRDFKMVSCAGGGGGNGPWEYCGPGGAMKIEELSLRGAHQVRNAASALALTGLLEGDLKVCESAKLLGLAKVRWPGRGEVFTDSKRRRVLLDACHNPAAVLALKRLLRELTYRKLHVVVGAMSDKDLEATLVPLVEEAETAIITRAAYYRSCAAEELIKRLQPKASSTCFLVVTPVEKAVAVGVGRSSPEDLVVVTGSVFLVGEARSALLGEKTDPFQVTDPVHPPEIPRSRQRLKQNPS